MQILSRDAFATARRLPVLGLQLFSLDAEMQRDPAGTLREVSGIGYRQVELVGYYGLESADLGAALRAASLSCRSIHIRPHGRSGLLPGLAADPELHFRRCRELGVRYIVCPGPWFAGEVERTLPTATLGLADVVAAVERMTAKDWRQSAERINACAAAARRHGLQLLYHNGNFEFARCGTASGFDTLLRHLDPRLVELELDCGWVMAAGEDPLRYLRDYSGRVPLIHIKDLTATPPNHRMQLNPAQLGEGIVDWPVLMAAAVRAGVQCAFVEQEAPYARPPLEYARNNFEFYRTLE